MEKIDMNKDSIFVVDGTNLIHRNYYVFQNKINKNGVNIGGLYGTIRSLQSYIKNFNPKQIFICFDKGKQTFRHKTYPDYKGKRKKTDEELKNQFALFEKFCKLANFPFIEMDLYEADDLVASLCYNANRYDIDPYAVTGDKDIFQLIDKGIDILYLSNKGPIIYGESEFIEEFGIQPNQYIDYKALVGDSSNNVPGVPGIGHKTAQKLLTKYDSLDGIYDNTDNLKGKQKERIIENKDNAYLYKKLSELKCDVDLNYDNYFVNYINKGYNLKNYEVVKFLNNLGIN